MGLTTFVADPGQTGDLIECQDSGGLPYLSAGPPDLPADGSKQWLRINRTFPASPTAAQIGAFLSLTTAGAANKPISGCVVNLGGGYTGPHQVQGLQVAVYAEGTGATFAGAAYNYGYRVGKANIGAGVFSVGDTTGNNLGLQGVAGGGGMNFGLWGSSTAPKAGAVNAGVSGFGLNTAGGGAVHCGGYFALADYGTSAPSVANAALVADNGTTADPIARFRVNGVDQVVIDQNGGIVLARMADATAAGGRLYFSTDAGKLVYKDSGGAVNPLY